MILKGMNRRKSDANSVSKNKQGGFGLLETLLTVGILMILGSTAMVEEGRKSAHKQSDTVGEQLATVGGAVNVYTARHYHKIIELRNSPGTGSADDPGPRFCTANVTNINGNPASYCTITTDTLVRNGLLPTSFSGRNAYNAGYDIYIRVVGTAPNWIVEGMVVVNRPYTTGAGIRYDLMGRAMQKAGADSGMTRTLPNTIEGLYGTWRDNAWPSLTHNGVTYPGVNSLGLLTYRVGYGSSGYAAYLRLDGTTPMTGSLDLDGHDINDVGVVTANAAILRAAGTGISMNHDAGTDRTDFVAGAGTLAIRNAGGLRVENLDGTDDGNLAAKDISASGNVSVNGHMNVDENLAAQDIRARGSIEAAGNINTRGAFNVIDAGNNAVVRMDATGLQVGGTGRVTSYDVVATNSVAAGTYTLSNAGLSNGGAASWFYDSAAAAWRTTESINIGENVSARRLISTDSTQVGGALMLTGSLASAVVTEGDACSTSHYGQLRRTGNTAAAVVTCVSGAWRRIASGQIVTVNSGTVGSPGVGGGTVTASANCPAGSRVVGGGYALVSFVPLGGGYDGNAPSQSYPNGNSWTIALDQRTGASSFQARATCMF